MERNRYSRKDIIKFLQFQEDFPSLFLSREGELNGEFWGPDDYSDEPMIDERPMKVKEYNDDLKSDNWG